MIPETLVPKESPLDWKDSLQQVVRNVSELLEILKIDPAHTPFDCDPQFPLRVPREFVAKMREGDINDPLLRQVLPLNTENEARTDYTFDPLQEPANSPLPGILHKFSGRVLFTLTKACAVHCRYCFRRHFPYEEHTPNRAEWLKNLAYIQADPSIREVILSGGDPLCLSDEWLATLIQALADIPQVQILRIHTRFPVMIPHRITTGLIQALKSRLSLVWVFHINHPYEIDGTFIKALAPLKTLGWTLLNQSVLLRGVNDEASVLIDLSHRLFEAGILPYYIHLLDRVQGTHHFDIPLKRALALKSAQQAALPGYLFPRWARETPGYPHKLLL